VRELAVRLREHAHVEVACLKSAGPVAVEIRAAGIDVTAFNAASAFQLPRVIRAVRELIQSRRIDTVLSFLIHANFVASRAVRAAPNVRLFQSIQTIQPTPTWHWWLQTRIAASAERIIVPSNAIVDFASKRCAIPRGKFVVIPNAIDPSAFSQTAVCRGDNVRIGYLGRLDHNKRPADAIDVLSRLMPRENFIEGDAAAEPSAELRDFTNGLGGTSSSTAIVSLHFFGEGPARQALVARATAFGLKERVLFHGAVARPQDALSQIDVLLLPSRIEGFGLVLIEAMAAGVPVVTCNAGGVRDVVQHEFNGLLASDVSNMPADLAACVRRVIEDSALRARIIENGLRSVRERFTWEQVLPAYTNVLANKQMTS
jgi:glycosyltransferase involved in cell wall biosynthesis